MGLLSACSRQSEIAPAIANEGVPVGVRGPNGGGGGGGSVPNAPQFSASQSAMTEPLTAFCGRSGSALFTPQGNRQCTNEQANATLGHALCVCGDLHASYTLASDSFDSRSGSYASATAHASASIGVNGSVELGSDQASEILRAGGDLAVGSASGVYYDPNSTQGMSAQVDGRLSVGGPVALLGDLTVGGDAAVGGDLTVGALSVAGTLTQPSGTAVVSRTLSCGAEDTAAVNVDPPCACGERPALDVPNLVACGAGHNDNEMLDFAPELFQGFTNGARIPLPCGRLYVPAFNGTGTLTLLVPNRTVLFVAGDLISGALTIDTQGSGELDLFVEGSLHTGGSFTLGNTDHPEKVRVYLGGSDPILLGGGSHSGTLYAPSATVTVSADSDYYGSLFVNELVESGRLNVHYDEALLGRSSSCQ